MKNISSFAEIFAMREGARVASIIEEKIAIVFMPKPWWCPQWLYRKIISQLVKIIQ